MSRLDRSLLAGLAPFEGTTAADLDETLNSARALRVARGHAVFEQGGETEAFYLLLDGHVRVVKTTRDGEQVIMRYISAGELFGIAPAFGHAAYPASAIAAVDCVVLAWSTRLWEGLCARMPNFSANVYKTAGARLQQTQDMVVDMSTRQVEQRVAHALLRLVRQTGVQTEEGLLIDFPISRQDIAEMTGTTLHTVSRLLAAWEGQGLVKSGRQRVTVVAPHQLLLLAEGRSKD